MMVVQLKSGLTKSLKILSGKITPTKERGMKRIFMFVGLLFALVTSVHAEYPTHHLDFICCSYHFDRSKEYNETNRGLIYRHYYKHNMNVNVGVYENSEWGTSGFIGNQLDHKLSKNFNFTLDVGLVFGYERFPVFPYVVPGVSYKDFVNVQLGPNVIGASVTIFKW